MNRPPDQLLRHALEAHRAGQLPLAEATYRQILAVDPNHLDSLHLLGLLALQTGHAPAAVELIAKAAALSPLMPELWLSLGNAQQSAGRVDAAIGSFRRAIQLRPDFASAYVNLGNAFKTLDRLDEAWSHYQAAKHLDPALPEIYTGLGNVLCDRGDIPAAVQAYSAAIRLRDDYPEAHHNLGGALLALGDFQNGWPHMEWRWKLPAMARHRFDTSKPVWRGEPLNGRTILLRAEQGWGDSIQFIRYAPRVAERGGRIIASVPPDFVDLIRDFPCISQVHVTGEPPPFDVYCPLMSLPLVFQTTLQTIPATCPYLKADAESRDRWSAKLHGITSRLKVGLVWAGRPTHEGDRKRSITLAHFAPLAKGNATFFSLQKGPAAAQAAAPPPGMQLIDFTADVQTFSDTAALIEQLDLVISVDTGVAHLAGALGKPVWTLLPHVADWRWLIARTDTPWYPTMRLFRQTSPGDWASVIERARASLSTIL